MQTLSAEPKGKGIRKISVAAMRELASKIMIPEHVRQKRGQVESQVSQDSHLEYIDTDDTAEVPNSSSSGSDNDPSVSEKLMADSNGGIRVQIHSSPVGRRHTDGDLHHEYGKPQDGGTTLRSSSSADTILSIVSLRSSSFLEAFFENFFSRLG